MKTRTVFLPGTLFSAASSDLESFSMSISDDSDNNNGSLLLLSGVRARRQQHVVMTAAQQQQRRRRSTSPQFASATTATAPSAAVPSAAASPSSSSSSKPKLELKPASDVLAGAVARAASQSTVHPLDTLKVRMQAADAVAASSSARAAAAKAAAAGAASASSSVVPVKGIASAAASVRSLYAGVAGAASGAGLYIGTYFAFYGAACNLLTSGTDLPAGAVAFLAGGAGAVGGSVVKVPLAVCIRSVQAGVYPSAPAAAAAIVKAAGVRGLFTGYVPTLLEDVPDMAVKFAVYETLRAAHARLMTARARASGEFSSTSKKGGKAFSPRPPSMGEDFAMGAVAGAAAAAATTPLDVVKTNMMCSAASRPTMREAARAALARGGGRPSALFTGVGPRALSNGINSAVFFAFFSVLRGALAKAKAAKVVAAAAGSSGLSPKKKKASSSSSSTRRAAVA